MALVVTFARRSEGPKADTPAALAAVTLIVLYWISAPRSVTVLVFGGSAVYAAVMYALVILLLTTRRAEQTTFVEAALLTAVLTPNSALHAGVGLVARTSLYNVAHAMALLLVAAAWLLRLSRHDTWRPAPALAGLVTFLMLVAGTAAVLVLGTQAAVQNAGVYGIGRVMAVLLAAHAIGHDRIFAKQEHGLRPRAA